MADIDENSPKNSFSEQAWDLVPIMPEAQTHALPPEEALDNLQASFSAMLNRLRHIEASSDEAFTNYRERNNDTTLANNVWQLISAISLAQRAHAFLRLSENEHKDNYEIGSRIYAMESGELKNYIIAVHEAIYCLDTKFQYGEKDRLFAQHDALKQYGHLLEFPLAKKIFEKEQAAAHYKPLPNLQHYNPTQEAFDSAFYRIHQDTNLTPEDRANLAADTLSQRIYADWQKANPDIPATDFEALRQGTSTSALFARENGFPDDIIDRMVNELWFEESGAHTTNEESWSFEEARELIVKAYTDFHPRMGEIANEILNGTLSAAGDNQQTMVVQGDGKLNKTFAILGMSKKDYAFGRDFISMQWDSSTHALLTLAHETAHAVAMMIEGETVSTNARLQASPLHETFAHFGEKLVTQELLASSPDRAIRQERLNIAQAHEAGNINIIGYVQLEKLVSDAVEAKGDALSAEEINTLIRPVVSAMYNISEDDLTVEFVQQVWTSAIQLFDYGSYYNAGYVAAEMSARTMANAFFTVSPNAQADMARDWVDVMAHAGEYKQDYAGALAQVGIDIAAPDFFESAVEKNTMAVAMNRLLSPHASKQGVANSWVKRTQDSPTLQTSGKSHAACVDEKRNSPAAPGNPR